MVEFFRRALKKLAKIDTEQQRELLISAVDEINLLETVLNSIDVGILVCDQNNNLVMVNKCAQFLLPVNYTEGVKLWEAIEDDSASEFLREALKNGDRIADREIDIVHKGQNKLLSFNVLPLVYDRSITGSLIYINDITEKRAGEIRLRRAENLASLTTLTAGVAHEIKNPLGAISIHIQLLQKALAGGKYSEKKAGKYFDVIKEELNRLNNIVLNFLYAVRPLPLELRKGSVNDLISKIMEFIVVEMEQAKIICLLELDENIPEILMDDRLMKQALLNLIKNALTAMPKGGVFTIATKYVDGAIRISICDTGKGIKKENLTKIFEPYFTTTETGTGLGLTQVYKIIREHHGEITVDSSPDTGTEFRVILPVPQKEMRMIAYNDKVHARQ